MSTARSTPYHIAQLDDAPVFYDAVEFSVDPLAFGLHKPRLPLRGLFSAAAALALGGLGSGEFFTGLTRDDVGGLRYLYRRLNINGRT